MKKSAPAETIAGVTEVILGDTLGVGVGVGEVVGVGRGVADGFGVIELVGAGAGTRMETEGA